MKILFLCGVFAPENEKEVVDNAVAPVEFSANQFQLRLIEGFHQITGALSVVSAPFIGAWPTGSQIRWFHGFRESVAGYTYVSFNNIWGLRNFSRATALKKSLGDFIRAEDAEKRIVVYSAHTPFLQAAVWAKRQDARIRICLYVPDLPEYMNLTANHSVIYDFCKKIDIAVMHRLMTRVDSFVLLTKDMKEKLPVGNKPYLIREGIIGKTYEASTSTIQETRDIVYTGRLDEAFGLRSLIDAFSFLTAPDCRLILCGAGDCEEYANSAARKDHRIVPLGQISPVEAASWRNKASVLVNPRLPVGEYTRFSFPSKNIEYLMNCKPVVAYMLRGMPECYARFIFPIPDDLEPAYAIAQTLSHALEEPLEKTTARHRAFVRYAEKSLAAERIAHAVTEL